jgi:hypothetical protein
MSVVEYSNLIVSDTQAELPVPAGVSGAKRVAVALDTGKILADVAGSWQEIAIQGAAGPEGPEGPEGPMGPAGPAGETGPAGPQGIKGDTGDAGAEGAQGPQGPAGEQGEQGIQGVQGIQGPAGSAYVSVPFFSGTVTLTNMALADTELPAVQYRLKLDLTGFTQFRATCRVATQGATNSDIRFQGSLDDSSYSNLDGGAGPEIALFGTGEKDTGWVTLAAGFRAANVRVRMMGKDGDGTADPVVRQIVLHFK